MTDRADQAEGSGDAAEPQPLNREQRRAQKFHRGAGNRRQDNLHTQRENASGFLTDRPAPTGEESDGSPEEGPTRSGAGTGGAVESDERLTHHEGMHLGNQPNS